MTTTIKEVKTAPANSVTEMLQRCLITWTAQNDQRYDNLTLKLTNIDIHSKLVRHC